MSKSTQCVWFLSILSAVRWFCVTDTPLWFLSVVGPFATILHLSSEVNSSLLPISHSFGGCYSHFWFILSYYSLFGLHSYLTWVSFSRRKQQFKTGFWHRAWISFDMLQKQQWWSLVAKKKTWQLMLNTTASQGDHLISSYCAQAEAFIDELQHQDNTLFFLRSTSPGAFIVSDRPLPNFLTVSLRQIIIVCECVHGCARVWWEVYRKCFGLSVALMFKFRALVPLLTVTGWVRLSLTGKRLEAC